MEFRLDDDQLELQATVERFCADRFPLEALSDREGRPVDRDVWAGLADLGVFGLLVDEVDGGAGLGVVEAAIVFEQLGRYLAPGPACWTVLAADLVDGAVDGSAMVTGVDAAHLRDGAGIVPHGAEADAVLVLDDDGVIVHGAAAGSAGALDALDPLGTVARLDHLTDGRRVGDAALSADLRRLGTVLCAATLVGIADRSLDVARSYALEREQFDRPIGSFQAVKHLLADMYVRTSCAQSATYAAAAVLDDPRGDDPARAAAGAKLLAADAALENAGTAIQVLGGMGFTWEMPPNFLLKRAWVLEADFGTRAEQEATLGALVGVAGRDD